MCLEKVHRVLEPDNQIRTAYKAVLRGGYGEWMLPYYHLVGARIEGEDASYHFARLPRGKWIEASTGQLEACSGQPYPAGFHAFLSVDDAERYLETIAGDGPGPLYIIAVQVMEIVALGKDRGDSEVLVARKLRLPED